MQDAFPIPSCFAAPPVDKFPDDPMSAFAATKPGQSVVTSVYRTKISGHTRLIHVSWCRNILIHGLCVSIADSDTDSDTTNTCKIELRPWCFWRKTGSKKLTVAGETVKVVWDLHAAKFCGEPEPRSNYFVAIVHDNELVLLLGDRRVSFRPCTIQPALVSKKEHVFGKKRFATRSKFEERGKFHDIVIECRENGESDPEMAIRIDGDVAVRVKHLQWKFRGNEIITVSKCRVEVYWDVHDMLFSPGMRHALFIFKPLPMQRSTVLSSSGMPPAVPESEGNGACLFLYAWKLE